MTETRLIRVGLVQGYRLSREAMRSLLQAGDGVVVVAEANGEADVIDMVDAHKPDLVILVLDGGADRDFALLHRLPEIADRALVLVVTAECESSIHSQAIESGARGVVVMDESAAVLLKAVHKVCAGEIWLDRARTAGVLNRLTRRRVDVDPDVAKIDTLTPRERQIVGLVTEGFTNRDIAERLYISEATARNHLTSILDKLDLPDRFQLTVYAFRKGLVVCPRTPAMLRVGASMNAEPVRMVRDRAAERTTRAPKR